MTKKITNIEKNSEQEKEIRDIKEEVLSYAKDRIDIEVQASVRKAEKKLLRSKTGKILRRDFVILFLLTLIGFMGFDIYRNGFFDKYLDSRKSTKTEEVEKEQTKEKEETIEKDEENKEEVVEPEKDLSFHEVALEKYFINSSSDYLEDYYDGNLTNELLLELTLNNFDLDLIEEDEDTYMIDSSDLTNLSKELFDDIKVSAKSFKYNGNSIKYLKSSKMFLATEEIKIKDSDITRVVTDISEDDDIVTISTVEAIVKDEKVHNVLTNKEVCVYKNEKSLKDKKDSLNELVYTFKYEDEEYKLISIKKK